MDVLDGVVALVVCSDPNHTAKPAMTRMLKHLGAKVVQRLSKDVSHIVYERRQAQRTKDKDAEQELQDLYSKAGKFDPPPTIVSPSWVEESRTAKRRLVERKFVIARPKEALLAKPVGRTPGSGARPGKKRKQAAPPPKPVETFDLADVVTSSQQIRGDGPLDTTDEVASPRHGCHGQKRAAKPTDGGRAAKAAKPHAGKDMKSSPGFNGTDTQQVADIMAGLLGDGQADTPGPAEGQDDDGWEGDGDELDTPLSLRLAKSASRSASKDAERRHSGPVGRSRLAQASGPHAGAQAGAAAEPEPEDGTAEKAGPHKGTAPAGQNVAGKGATTRPQPAQRFSVRQLVKLDDKPLPLHKGTPLPGVLPPPSNVKRPKSTIPVPAVERVTSPWQDAEELPSQSQSQHSQQQAASRDGQAGDAEPRQARGAQQLQHNDRHRPVLHAGVRDASPASIFKPPAMIAAAGHGNPPWSTVRPWDRRAQQPPQQPVSHPVAALRPGGKAAGQGAGQGGFAAWPAAAGAAVARQLPRGHAAAPRGVLQPANQDVAGSSKAAKRTRQQQQPEPPAAEPPGRGAGGKEQAQQWRRGWRRVDGAGGAGAAGTEAAAEQHSDEQGMGVEDGDPDGMGPSHGYIAFTSVDSGVGDLCKAAARRLRGLRLCAEGREDGKITHLVIGKERRTLKLMLAVANGAWLVSPEWVTASLEAGKWLPESQYLAKVRFVSAAESARCQLEVPDAPALLHNQDIYIHISDAARKSQASNAAALKRVALALGAAVVPPKSCTLCVVVGGGGRPTHLPKQTPAVREEWLLMAAERFQLPSTSSREFMLR